MRARKKPWAKQEIITNERVIHNPKDMKGKWHEFFGNDKPIHIEIGCGKGRFINELAKQNPDINYIAIEREENIIATAVRSARENGTDIQFIVGDVQELGEYFASKEVERIYINFCDPWHRKKKWAKRRLTHKNFLNIYRTVFTDTGSIFFKTDNRILFEFSLNELVSDNWKLKNITLDLHSSDYEGNIMTEYEEKFSQQGVPIYRTEAYL